MHISSVALSNKISRSIVKVLEKAFSLFWGSLKNINFGD